MKPRAFDLPYTGRMVNLSLNTSVLRPLLATVALVLCASASAQTFQSQAQASQVIELFTSEGCSSCPPADRWLSGFKKHPELFTSVIPLAFHVDYWDYIGWQDPFANPDYSNRQRRYDRDGGLSSVYTPGFVVNGEEWRRWFSGHHNRPSPSRKQPGVLQAELSGNILTANFASAESLQLNIAYLGMGLSSKVTAGENNHRQLQHDFVVLEHWQLPAKRSKSGELAWHTELKPTPDKGQQQSALVIWLSNKGEQMPIQATGILLAEAIK